jgi:hypothetical protein
VHAVFGSFSKNAVYMGTVGSGMFGKLFDNALTTMNRATAGARLTVRPIVLAGITRPRNRSACLHYPALAEPLAAWSCSTCSMAATITWADPSTACATGLDGSRSWLAIWRADSPASTCGSYCAPARMY